MLKGDNFFSQSRLQQTAQFFNPEMERPQGRQFRRLKPQEQQVPKVDLPTIARKSSQEIIAFDQLVIEQLNKYAQNAILRPNWNLNNTIEYPQRPNKFISLNNTRSIFNLIPMTTNTSPDKRRNIKVLGNPFNESRNNRKSNHSAGSTNESVRPSKSQGRSFLQRKPQIKILNRIFSSQSQHML